jgi:hypothetical protein
MRILALLILAVPNVAAPAVIEQAVIRGQPQMIMEAGRPTMCGLRVVAQPTTFRDPQSHKVFMLDTSLVMGREGLILIKGFGIETTPNGLAKGDFKKIRLSALWFKPDGSRATQPLKGETSRDDEGIALMYADKETFQVYTSFLNSVINGLNVTIGFRLGPNDDERIVTGVVTLNESDMASFGKCNVEIAEQ